MIRLATRRERLVRECQDVTVVLAEGWFDWYALQLALPNVLTFLTASIGPKHLDVLERYTTHLVLMFDRGYFGRKSQYGARTLRNIERSKLTCEVVEMPDGVEADDWSDALKVLGRDEFVRIVRGLAARRVV